MSTPDLVNLANQLACNLDKSPGGEREETAVILNLHFQEMKIFI